MQRFWNEILNFSQSLTQQVGEGLLEDFGKVVGKEKEDGSVVTIADQQADAQIREAIQTHFPHHGILTEEAQEAIFRGTEWCWVVDPIDGTNNFTCGIPLWGISLGLLFQGSPLFGYLHFPALHQSYHGFDDPVGTLQVPSGVFCNGKPMEPRPQNLGNNELFTCCSRSLQWVKTGLPYKVRMFGSSVYEAVCVATGQTLGAVTATSKIWDIAGAYPLVQATGAAWLPLVADPFPLVKGHDYLRDSFPFLVLANTTLEPALRGFIDFSKG